MEGLLQAGSSYFYYNTRRLIKVGSWSELHHIITWNFRYI
ncbi:hypothetical protein ERO13_D12G115050v2 [Gossypium hirsutum]|nr:hypothetical protein ERO13_D12G115050v2 [Gossypium hirsutum]